MHPLLAKYLSLDVAIDTLYRDELGQVLKADERPFAQVAKAHPQKRAAVLGSRGKKQVSPEIERAQVFLAAQAVVVSLRDDAELGPSLSQARIALADEGATEEQVEELFASLVLEEAFGDPEGEADEPFDRTYFDEGLKTLGALAQLTSPRVLELHQRFTASADAAWSYAHKLAAQCLFDAAWSEGPAPMHHEHVDEALEAMHKKLSSADQARAAVAMKRLLAFLHQEKLIGSKRLTRLTRAVELAELGAAGARAH